MILKFWLGFNAITYLMLGILFIFQFEMITGNLGIFPQDGSAAIELITVYGGLELGFGILFLTALFVGKYRLFALQILTFSYLSFAVGRMAGIIGYEVTDPVTYYLLVFEVLGIAVSSVLLRRSLNHTE